MAAKKDPDEIRISVVVDASVSEKAWRAMCSAQGIDLAGANAAAHIGRSVKEMTVGNLKALGVLKEAK